MRFGGIFEEMHQYYDRRYTPKVKIQQKHALPVLEGNMPSKARKAGSVKEYLKRALEDNRDEKTAQYIVRYFGKQLPWIGWRKILLFMKNRRSLEGCRCIIWRELFFGYRGMLQRLVGACADRNISCVTFLRRRENFSPGDWKSKRKCYFTKTAVRIQEKMRKRATIAKTLYSGKVYNPRWVLNGNPGSCNAD